MAYAPNKKNLTERANYGVRVARPGYDANNCAQNQLLFNSGWPILQITEVIDIRGLAPIDICEYSVDTTVIKTATGDVASETKEISYPSEPPSGYNNVNTYYYDPNETIGEYKSISVNRKYIKKEVAGTRTVYNYPEESSTSGEYTTTIAKICYIKPCIKKNHRLSYTPFFMTSDMVSNIDGYVILFSVDIAKDIDYPYTEKPLALLSPATDYGIKSSSKFGRKVPGLCSNMFSKLVQAVKTEETSVRYNNDLRAIWSPVKDASKAKGGELLPYEFYSFIGEAGSGIGIDGGVYYRRDWPFYMSRYSGGTLNDAWAVSVTSFQDKILSKNSLVVLRSPMVSPEYEERVI